MRKSSVDYLKDVQKNMTIIKGIKETLNKYNREYAE